MTRVTRHATVLVGVALVLAGGGPALAEPHIPCFTVGFGGHGGGGTPLYREFCLLNR